MWRIVTLLIFLASLVGRNALAEENVRVATYNIKFLSTEVQHQGDRLQKLRAVIELLEADVIGLQEIDDRAALRLLFPANEWRILIDDDSGENQDLALVVRNRLSIQSHDTDLDADDQDFLFPSSGDNTFFPDRRDVLQGDIVLPGGAGSLTVLVHHGKSRFGGRATTEFRRVGASTMLLNVLERDFEDQRFILLGDFNDSPDDTSLNILETGNPNAMGQMEESPGPFLINLTEPLYAHGMVSHGRKSNELVGDRVDLVDTGSRQRNHDARGTNQNTGDILFDQILIPPQMLEHYVQGSAAIFHFAIGARGNNTTRASDHLPVFADFVFATPEDLTEGPRITGLLPNPDGQDAGNEAVALLNPTQSQIDLTGWKLMDRSSNEFPLSGFLAAGEEREIVMQQFSMPLNNAGDTVQLVDPDERVQHEVTYGSGDVSPGGWVRFAE